MTARAEPLVEVLLEEEGAVAAEGAPFDRPGRGGGLEPGGIGLPAFRTAEVPGISRRVLAGGQAAWAVAAGAHGQTGKPVATVRYEARSSPIRTKTSAT